MIKKILIPLIINLNFILLIFSNINLISEDILIIVKLVTYFLFFYFSFSKNRNNIIVYGLVIFGVFTIIFYGRMYFFTLILYSLVLDKENFKKYSKQNIYLLTITFLIIILFSKIGITDNIVLKQVIFGNTKIIERHSLGFGNPNTPGLIFWLIRCVYYYKNFHKIKFYHFIVLGIFVGELYFLTYSRTGIIIFIVEIIFYYLFRYGYKLIKKTLKFSIFIHFLLNCILIFKYHETFLNKFLSNRLEFSFIFFKTLNLKTFLLGSKEKFYIPLDNSYVRFIQEYGFILLIILIILIYRGIKNILNNQIKFKEQQKIFFIYYLVLVYSFSERVLFHSHYSIIILHIINYGINNKYKIRPKK